MDLRPYVETIHQQLADAAEAAGVEAQALAQRLAAPLDAAIRLALQDALGAAVEEITRELAPGSVELRIRGRNPEFVVTPPPAERGSDDFTASGRDDALPFVQPTQGETDEGATSRINLRLPEHLKTRVEQAASGEGLSVNTWLVRAAGFALDRVDPSRRREGRAALGSGRYTGWVR
jgi:hypothetical protein